MVTVHREGGLRFVIFIDDHAPAHVHVFGDGTAKINLSGEEAAPELVYAAGMKAGDLRKAMRIVAARHDEMMEKWSEIHG